MLRLAFVLVLFALPATAQEAGRLTVTGAGSVLGKPDMAVITLGVTDQGDTAAGAMQSVSAATAAVLAALADQGVAEADIQTSDLSLSPLWANRSSSGSGDPTISGYEAANTVTVRLRALDGVGAVLDTAIDAGANTFRGLSFGLQNPEPALDEARRLAVADALRKARLYAEAAGVGLGGILEIDETGGQAPPVAFRNAAAMESVPVAPGQIETGASVTVVFAIAGR